MENEIQHLYQRIINHGIKATRISNLIAKTLSELSPEEQTKMLNDYDEDSWSKIFMSAYDNGDYELCNLIKKYLSID